MTNKNLLNKNFFIAIGLIVLILGFALFVSFPEGKHHNFLLILFLLIFLIIIYYLFQYPEVAFGLFLTAGFFKGDIHLKNILPDFFDLTIFFAFIVVLAILMNIFKKKISIPYISLKLILPYLGLLLLMLLSLIYTLSPIYGADKFLKFATLTTLTIFAPLFLFRNKIILERFIYTIIALSTIMSIDAFIAGSRAVFSATYLGFGRITGASVLIIIFYFMIKSNVKRKTVWLLLLLINLAGLFYSAGRAPIVILVFTTIVMLFLSFNFKKFSINKPILLCFILIIFLTILSIFFFPQITQTSLARFNVMLSEFQGTVQGIPPVGERMEMFSLALKGFFHSPFFGVGIGGFSAFAYGVDVHSYPHNILLEIGSELGILGILSLLFLIGFCFFYLIFLRKMHKEKEKYFLITMILSLFIFMFLNSLVSGEINDVRLFFVWIGTTYALNGIFRYS